MTEPERLQPEPGPDAGLDEIQTDIDQTRQQLGETSRRCRPSLTSRHRRGRRSTTPRRE